MIRLPRAALFPLFLTLGVLAAGRLAVAQDPGGNPYSPRASSSASGSASLEPPPPLPVVSGHKLWVPSQEVDPLPEQPTPRPTAAEWVSAPLAREARVTEPNCKVFRLREWYRIHCEHLAIQQVGGTREGVEFGKVFRTKLIHLSPSEVWVVFPARRGDRRFFQLYSWSKWAPGIPDAHGSMQWLDGDPLPLITVQGLRWGI